MTKLELVQKLSAQTGVNIISVQQIVQLTLDGIVDVLVTEKRLELRDFGVFEVRLRKARRARNPRTGISVDVPERNGVTFKPGRNMQSRVNTAP